MDCAWHKTQQKALSNVLRNSDSIYDKISLIW